MVSATGSGSVLFTLRGCALKVRTAIAGVVVVLPFSVAVTLVAKRRLLPENLRPRAFFAFTMIVSSVFYAALGVLQLLSIAGVELAGSGA